MNGQTISFSPLPVDEAMRPRLVEEYLRRWGEASRHFQQLLDPADHPTFRIVPA